jgi:iron complex outermembrane recepter protein
VSGPGAALWGTNAVNGVINVISRPAQETKRTYASVLAGESASHLAFRYGGEAGTRGAFRIYAKGDRKEATEDANGNPLLDEWDSAQAGLRADWELGSSSLSVHGDAYRAETTADRLFGPVETSGANLVGRWERALANGSGLRVQTYFDYSERENLLIFGDRLGIFDTEVLHNFSRGKHQVVWGGGYRASSDETTHGLLATFRPENRNLDWWSLFAQDEIALGGDWGLIAATRVERNDYTGTEVLPSLRATWKPRPDRLVWGAVSRAVRAPSRIDREFRLPGAEPFIIVGGPSFESEIADVFELGTRGQVGTRATYSLTAFHHSWDRLRSGQPVANGFEVQNGLAGSTSGIEGWFSLDLAASMRVTGGATYLEEDIHRKTGSLDPTGPSALGNDPDFQAQIGLAFELGRRFDGDLRARYVGELPDPEIPSYSVIDLRFSWTPTDQLALGLIVENALDDRHAEFQPGALAAQSEFGRSVSIRLRWQH